MHSSAVTPETDTTIVQLQIPEEQMKFANETLTVSIPNVHTIESRNICSMRQLYEKNSARDL